MGVCIQAAMALLYEVTFPESPATGLPVAARLDDGISHEDERGSKLFGLFLG
jgi:hypothetical protein